MKIAFILPADILGGGPIVVYEHAQRLQNRGYEVVVIFLKPPCESDRSPSANYSLRKISWEEAFKEEFDCVIATWWETAFSLFKLKARHLAYFVQSDERRFYGSREIPIKYLVEATYQMPVNFVTEARWIKAMLSEEFGKEAHLVPNAVSHELFFPVEPIQSKKPGKLRLLIEGPGAVEYKRVGFCFEVCSNMPDIELWYVSTDGFIHPSWKADRVFSRQPQGKMREIYSSCDVLLKLSTVEGFFGPPLEMMACGGTAIVSDVSGHDEYVVDGHNALVVAADDKEQARAAINRLKESPSLLAELKSNGLKTANRYSWDRSNDQLVSALEIISGTEALPEIDRRHWSSLAKFHQSSMAQMQLIHLQNQELKLLRDQISRYLDLWPLRTARSLRRMLLGK